MQPVLIVEDDDAIREGLRDALALAGYEVYEAPDGRPALARLHESREALVVLLDLQMPGVDGEQVLRAVAANDTLATCHAYILMTAAYEALSPAVADLLARLGVPILPKPFDLDALLHAVQQGAERLA